MIIQLEELHIYLLVFARMSGFIFFNPLLGRKNIPSQVRAGLVLLLTLLIAPVLQTPDLSYDSIDMLLLLFRELSVGFICGFVYQIFYYLLLFIGDWMDTEFGMAMAKVFDPATNIQVSLTGGLLTILFALYIFATDSHLVIIQIFALSFKIVPVGAVNLSPEAFQFILELFIDVFSLVLRLLLPFAVVEFSLQIVLGIMMKLVPQIHVFVINFQLKQGLGLMMLFLMGPVIASFLNNYIMIMLENLNRALLTLA
ncbi:MAG: flagellar biosynthetic protein FliR [Candidatus Fimivivens sp.]